MVSLWPCEVTPPLAGLVETLLASPELSSLHLSRLYFGSNEDLTPGLIYTAIEYDKQRQQRNLPLLRLVHLHLGGSEMPYKINGMSERYGWDYLSRVTELESLRTLILDNSFNGTDLIEPKVTARKTSVI